MPTRSRLSGAARGAAPRFAATACLVCTYYAADTGFDRYWVAATLITALLVTRTAPQWAPEYDTLPAALPWPSWRALGLALGPGWLLMAAAGLNKAMRGDPRFGIVAFVLGGAWVLAGAAGLGRSLRRGPAPRWGPPTWCCLLLVVVIAGAARLWHLSEVPRLVHSDEGVVAFTARAFFADPERDWFAPPPQAGVYAIMHLNYALAGAGTLVFGTNLLGARSANALLGVLAVALLFAGVRRVSNLRVATAAALLSAVNHTHVAYSRITTGCIQPAFIVAALFAALCRVWTAPTYLNAVALGLLMGIAGHTNTPSIAMIGLLPGVLLILFVVQRAHMRRLAVPLAIFLVTTASAGAPLAAAWWHHSDELLARSREVSLLSPRKFTQVKEEVYRTDSTAEVIARQTWLALTGFQIGEDHQPHYGPPAAMADRYTAALMISGTLLLLTRFPQFLAVNALVVSVGYLLLGLGMSWAPGFERATGALPLGMVPAAVALVQCCGTLGRGPTRWNRWVTNLALALALFGCAFVNFRIYFVRYAASHTGNEESEAALLALRYADQHTVHLVNWSMRPPAHHTVRLIIGERPVRHSNDQNSVDYVREAAVAGDDIFILVARDTAARDALLARFPDAVVAPPENPPVPLLVIFVRPPSPHAAKPHDPRRLHPPRQASAIPRAANARPLA